MPRLEVHKFGGTSVGSAARMVEVARLVAEAARSARIVVVTSAMGGITDQLLAAADSATRGDRAEAQKAIAGVLGRHREALVQLADGQDIDEVLARIVELGRELLDLLAALVLLGDLTARTRDRLVSCGEKLAVQLLSVALDREGVDAQPLNADTFLETDDRFGEANPLQVVADRTIAGALNPVLEAGRVPVVTGFCGMAPDGATTTLGRGGSDYTATLVAAALSADEVTIWTDVDGVFSADPRVVPDARLVPQLNYREAAELSFYGAKVLHQRTMMPVARAGIPVRTRNSFDASAQGTRVDGRFTPGSHPVKATSAIRGQCLVSIEGKGMSGVPGVAARAFGALAASGINVTMISQSSSESSISLVVTAEEARAAEAALKQTFRHQLGLGEIEEIVVDEDVGLVAVVGLGMAHTPGIAGRVFGALGSAGVNVLAIAQGSSELNISLAVHGDDVDRAVRVLHGAFGLHRMDTGVEHPDGLDLLLLGCGQIGRALVGLLDERRDTIRERFGLEVRVVSVADRSGYLLEPAGIAPGALAEVLEAKESGQSLREACGARPMDDAREMVEAALAYRLSRPVLVDVSDADGAEQAFLAALGSGCDVVTANKKPMAGSMEAFDALVGASRDTGRLVRAEATVGAGLPVIDTLDVLLATGDRVTRAEGCLSGTLGFLTHRLSEGAAFSEAVREAVEAGYTEPDPYADLSGEDVARKGIILGRLAGLADGSTPVRLEGLVDASLQGLPLETFLARCAELDGAMAQRVSEARDRGEVIRYRAQVTGDGIDIGPVAVPLDSPLGGLKGSDNMIVFHSERYDSRPLVVTGPGAGVAVTAMGVLGDILRTAAQRSAS